MLRKLAWPTATMPPSIIGQIADLEMLQCGKQRILESSPLQKACWLSYHLLHPPRKEMLFQPSSLSPLELGEAPFLGSPWYPAYSSAFALTCLSWCHRMQS